jgi:hypothetical protein
VPGLSGTLRLWNGQHYFRSDERDEPKELTCDPIFTPTHYPKHWKFEFDLVYECVLVIVVPQKRITYCTFMVFISEDLEKLALLMLTAMEFNL